jgi:uncharacterized cupin superfamily protein
MHPSHPIAADTVRVESGSSYPEPFNSRMGSADWRALGEHFGLSQFGFNLETLQPGDQSSARHWHSLADEFIYMLEGELTLNTNDGAFNMRPGMCIGFRAGERNAHHLVNQSQAPARFLVVGSRVPGDTAFYPDDDLAWLQTEAGWHAVHKDGHAYPKSTSTGR